jgi:phage-related protein
MLSYSVKFNGNDIKDVPGVWLYNYNATDLPERDIKIHKLARRSLSIITSAEYTQKSVPVFLEVCSGSRQDTEATITAIKGLLQPQNGELLVEQSGELFQYTATMNEFNIEWEGSTAWVVIIFLASTPIAQAVDSDTLFSFNTTTSSASSSFPVGGSYVAEPVISLVINSITGGTGDINIFNGSTNQGIMITGTFLAGDQIEIDSANLVVTHNGENIDFTGAFPTFPPGVQIVGYSDTFSTRDIDVDGIYNVKIV